MTGAAVEPFSPQETAMLIPSLSTRAELHEVERRAIHEARLWAMRPATLRRDDLFSAGFAAELHRRMFRGIWKGAGQFRSAEAGQGWEPGRIAEGVRLFMDDADGWLRYSTYPVQESAVRLHHRLLSVRPWSNGNGRHARLMADIAVAAQGEVPLTWGRGLAAGRSARDAYLEAIAVAESGDMGPLLAFARS